MANFDAELQEIHDEMYKEEEAKPKKGFSTFDKRTKFWISCVIGSIIVFVYFEKITATQGLVIGGVVALIIAMSVGTDPRKKELTMIECQLRIYDLLTFLQEHPMGNYQQIPNGEIMVKTVGKKQWFQGQAFKRSFGVDIYDDERDITTMYFAEIDIFTGDLITFRLAPEGVTGSEKKDIVFLPNPEMAINKRRDEYIGKNTFGKK
jgi:hypothetical protein